MERFVISKRTTGWGDCIVSAVSAWHYARRVRRTLVIDWRNSLYLDDPGRNAFPAYFEPVNEIGGVPVVSDDSVGSRLFPSPAYESFGQRSLRGLRDWLASRNLAPGDGQTVAAYYGGHAEEWALVAGERDRAEPTILLQSSLSEGLPDLADRRIFLAALCPRPEIQAEIDRFAREELAPPAIGVHVRYGSRTIIDSHTPYWEDEDRAIAAVCDRIRRASARLGGHRRVFLCTDRLEVEAAIRSRIPDIVTRDKYFRTRDRRELHSWVNPLEIRAEIGRDALVEMYLLARVQALVCYPPESFFSFYARTCAAGPRIQVGP